MMAIVIRAISNLFIVIILLVMFQSKGLGESMNEKEIYSTIQSKYQVKLSIPFVLKSQKQKCQIFRNSLIGVRIEKVRVDDKEIKSQKMIAFLDDIDKSIININKDSAFIYILKTNEYSSDNDNWIISLLESSMENASLLQYKIPKGSEDILIDYRILFSDNTLSSNQLLKLRIE